MGVKSTLGMLNLKIIFEISVKNLKHLSNKLKVMN